MVGYIVRRTLVAILVTIGVAAITFWLLHLLQSSPVHEVLGRGAKPAAIAAWNKQNGYDRPLVLQFLSYLGNLAHLNFGWSYKQGQSVWQLFKEYAGRSIYLSGSALILSLLIAMPVGIAQAVKRNSIGDYAMTTITFVLYAMPPFFLGLILIDVFAFKLGLFPPLVPSAQTSTVQALLHPRDYVLPIATLTLINVASFSRYMRSSALDNLAQDYIRLARAKGLSNRAVLYRHLLRNACLPMITLVGLSIPDLLAGNLLVEVLFNIQGLGLLFWNALQAGDYPILLAYTVLGGILTVLGNLAADIAVTVADPRVRI
jgi:peptide/nickel transport system permease protein